MKYLTYPIMVVRYYREKFSFLPTQITTILICLNGWNLKYSNNFEKIDEAEEYYESSLWSS